MPDAFAAATALSRRILDEARAGFFRLRQAELAAETPRCRNGASSSAISRTLPSLWLAIDEPHAALERQPPSQATVSFCSATSSAMPWRASGMS